MTRILTFAGFLALKIVLGTCDDSVVLTAGAIMRLQAPNVTGNVIQCFITSSQGEKYELFPNNESPGSYDGHGKRCSIEARDIEISYAGVWIMKTITENTNFETKFEIKMNQQKIVRPADYIPSLEGQWATVWLDTDRDDVTSCNLTHHQYETYNLMEDKVDDLIRTHGCGVRMLISHKMMGQWSFYAQYGDYLINSAMFQIAILNVDKDNEMLHKDWEIGQPAKLNIGNLHFCQFTRPDGTKLPVIYGTCIYEIPVVTAYHSGIWKVSYASSMKLELDHVKINVTTTDPNFVKSSFTPGFGNALNLMCRTDIKHMKLCSFIRPDNHVINVIAGLGNAKYSYYGQGYQEKNSSSREYGECGLTIHDPSIEDFGLWTCKMSVGRTVQSAVINVVKDRLVGQVRKVNSPNVFVKRGDDFKIRCSTNAALSYCWLTSPNGTDYSVSSAGGAGKTFKYDGKGFSMGECGAIVKTANDTDNGEWTCHLGIDKGAEVEATVAVKVTDAYIIAAEYTVYAQLETKLSCRTFLNDEATLRYCRWIRPNGHGINKEEASHYDLQKGMSDCTLTILTPKPEDIGQWQCVASLTRASGNEERATVNLKATAEKTTTTSALSIVLGSGFLIIILIGVFFAARRLYKRKNARTIGSPPPYFPQHYITPRVIPTSSEPTIQNND